VKPVRIGSLELKTPLLLAPIAGYCDLAFRLIARSHDLGCGDVGLAVTDLLCPEGVLRENHRSMQLARTNEADSPISMQLYGGDVEKLCDAARWCEDHGADVVDINMGCPVDKITKRDGGSKLLCDPTKTVKMAQKIAGVLKRAPLTAKLRLGWDDSCIVAPQLARQLEEVGVKMITIHGRTAQMKFTGNARLDGIAEVVASVKSIPVIGNGDIKSPYDAVHMMNVTGCRGVMIGRAALSMPWIFRDTWSYLTTGEIPDEPTIEQKCEMMRRHFYGLVRYRSGRAALVEFRKRVSWYSKTMHPCGMLKDPMRTVESPAQFDQIINDFLDWRRSRDEAVQNSQVNRPAMA
jgi:tRNA-dihydrouridine synthase B